MTEAGDRFRIRVMRPDEIVLAVAWAAREGWNPGHADAACFATVDPAGFLIGELDGQPAATISCVNYDPRFAFPGCYIVRPELRAAKAKFSSTCRSPIPARSPWREGVGSRPSSRPRGMYTGPVRPVQLHRVFGVMSFELG